MDNFLSKLKLKFLAFSRCPEVLIQTSWFLKICTLFQTLIRFENTRFL